MFGIESLRTVCMQYVVSTHTGMLFKSDCTPPPLTHTHTHTHTQGRLVECYEQVETTPHMDYEDYPDTGFSIGLVSALVVCVYGFYQLRQLLTLSIQWPVLGGNFKCPYLAVLHVALR